MALFQVVGTWPSLIVALNIFAIGPDKSGAQSRIIQLGISSGPTDLLTLILLSLYSTSLTLI